MTKNNKVDIAENIFEKRGKSVEESERLNRAEKTGGPAVRIKAEGVNHYITVSTASIDVFKQICRRTAARDMTDE